MSAKRFVLAVASFVVYTSSLWGAPVSVDFEGAKWIWLSFEANVALNQLPAGVRYFRGKVTLPEEAQVESAELIVTADNLFALYLNGQAVGESDVDNNAWRRPQRYDVASLLIPGRNVVAVEAVNTLPGPAGLIVKLSLRLTDGQQIVQQSDAAWKCYVSEQPNWQQPGFADDEWYAARVLGPYGVSPWGKPVAGSPRPPAKTLDKVHAAGRQVLEQVARLGRVTPVVEAPAGTVVDWPEAVVFVGDDRSLYRPLQATGTRHDSLSVTIFNARKSRSFPEHDLPAPLKVGRTLYLLQPARPGVKPRLLVDAGEGAIGSPSVSLDGRWIYFSMAFDGDPFYHIYSLPAAGGAVRQLTDGPFHDIDPAELPDGRIVFTSTRVGTFEEYHNPPSRALFAMAPDGSDVQPLTHTIIFDNEPEVLADGRILFVRSDNFFDRGKVETLLHAIHPDGTEGYTEFGLDNGPEYGGRLRAYYCGSPAPLPDGRVAFLSQPGITIGRLGYPQKDLRHFRLEAGDVAALPDGRLLCTAPRRVPVELAAGNEKRTVQDLSYQKIAILNPEADPPSLTVLYDSAGMPLHSPVYLGARPRPPVLAARREPQNSRTAPATGVLFCQNARLTKNNTAGWQHVRAIRVLAGKGLTTRSSHSYIVHAGTEAVELGTVPLAPDGSFAIEVPADTPIALQAVTAEGRSELNEMSWIYVRPGERRGCIGCHQNRQASPDLQGRLPLALRARPLRLLGQGDPHRYRGNNAAVTGLMELQFDRYREVAGINRHGDDQAVSGIHEVSRLATQLEASDPALRISAAQRLSVFRAAEAATALEQALQDEEREVRVATALALANCGTRSSVPALLKSLSDPDPLVAQAAANAVENLTGHREPFDPFAEDASRERQAAAWRQWFAGTDWLKIEASLLTRLTGGDRDDARRAAIALAHSGGETARAVLRKHVAAERSGNPFPTWRKDGRHRGDAARFNALADVNPRALQAAVRALGHLQDPLAVPLLAETIRQNSDPESANLFIAEAAAEALGRIRTRESETALVDAFAALKDYPDYTRWYGDHPALMACHASPVHYFIIEALDRLESKQATSILPAMIRSVPIDPDRALLLGNDDYEALVGRLIRRHGDESAVVETCLALLGEERADATPEYKEAIETIHRAWAGHPGPENRAAQILSMVCRNRRFEPRVRDAFQRYRAKPNTIPREFDTGIPVVLELPVKHWVCFYLARTLGNLGDSESVAPLMTALQEPNEAANGRPDPLGPGVLFLHNDLTPCWRAAAAWALGRIGDRRAVPVLLSVVQDLDNATDTRHAAARSLGRIACPSSLATLQQLAADYPEISTRLALQDACRQCLSSGAAHPVARRD